MTRFRLKCVTYALTSCFALTTGTCCADSIADAKSCLNQATGIASATVAHVADILSGAMLMGSLKKGELNLNGWSKLVAHAKGVYYTTYGWHAGSSGRHKFFNMVYLGSSCGILSNSRLACRLQVAGVDAADVVTLDNKLQQSIGFECTVCRGVVLGIQHNQLVEYYGVPTAMRASALTSDLDVAQQFSSGSVKIGTFEDELNGDCASSSGVSGTELSNL